MDNGRQTAFTQGMGKETQVLVGTNNPGENSLMACSVLIMQLSLNRAVSRVACSRRADQAASGCADHSPTEASRWSGRAAPLTSSRCKPPEHFIWILQVLGALWPKGSDGLCAPIFSVVLRYALFPLIHRIVVMQIQACLVCTYLSICLLNSK